MSTDTKTSKLILNVLSESQFENVVDPSENELWFTPDTTDEQLAQKQDKLIAGTDIEIVKQKLPRGYVELEYIQGTDNVQYIDTGIIPTSDMNFYFKFEYVGGGTTYTSGGRTGNGINGLNMFVRTTDSDVNLDFFQTNGRWTISNTVASGDVFEYRITNKTGQIFKNGTSLGTHTYTTDSSTTSTVYINGLNNGSGSMSSASGIGRVYRFTIEDVCDLIPAKRTTDNVVGMYDIVRDLFLANSGTGSFTAGPIVSIPSGYTELEYIEANGTQYIDTGFVPNNNSRMVIDYEADLANKAMIAEAQDYANGVAFGINQNSSNVDTAMLIYNGSSGSGFARILKTDIYGAGTGRYTVDINKQAVTITASNGSIVNKTITSVTYSCPYSVYLFANNREGTTILNGRSKMYSCKLYDNGTLVRNFVPVQRNSDGEFGLFDKVNQVFYTNDGTGDFTPGPAVDIDGKLVINFVNDSGFIAATNTPPASGTYVLKSVDGVIQWVAE